MYDIITGKYILITYNLINYAVYKYFQEIQRNLSTNHKSRNENYPNKPDNSKDVWNSKPNILSHSKSSGNIWNGSNSENQHSNAESFFNETSGSGNSLFYKSSSTESEKTKIKAGYDLDAANRNNTAQGIKILIVINLILNLSPRKLPAEVHHGPIRMEATFLGRT